MVDFAKLLARTPEERQADLEEAQRQYEVRRAAMLAERLEQLARAAALPDLTPREQEFVRHMLQLQLQHDPITSREAGKLLYLSDAQASWLADLAARSASSCADVEAPPAHAAAGDVFSRMRRLGAHRRLPASAATPAPTDGDDEQSGVAAFPQP